MAVARKFNKKGVSGQGFNGKPPRKTPNYREGLMVIERVRFHSNFGTFKQSRWSLEGFSIALIFGSLERSFIALAIHLLDPTRLAITNGFPFNPTYDSTEECSLTLSENFIIFILSEAFQWIPKEDESPCYD